MRRMLRVCVLAVVAGCGAADRELEVEALSARDVLGVRPSVAAAWSDEERDAVAEILARAAADRAADAAPLGYAEDPATAVLASVSEIDDRRSRGGSDAIVFARATITGGELPRVLVSAATPADEPGGDVELVASGWTGELAGLAGRAPDRLRAIAAAAGHPPGVRLVVHPAVQEPFASIYIAGERRLLVNPVYLLTLEPETEPEIEIEALAGRASPIARAAERRRSTAGGNPYSFFGSIAECAADQRLRCEGCLDSGTCETVTRDGADGSSECQAFAADNGRGYFLFCANLTAAIATAARCIADAAPACPINSDAGNLLAALDANAGLIDDPTCLEATDGCLASLYGDPDGDFGGVPDPADPPPPPPPPARRVDFGCSDNEVDCDFAPQIGCSTEGCSAGPSCGGCDGGCEGGGCDSSCDGGSGCDSSCDSGSCEGGSCEGCDSSSCEAGSCESCDSGGGSGGGGCNSGGGCSGGDCGGGGSCGGGDCGGGGSQCSVAHQRRAGGWGPPFLCALIPLFVIGRMRSRERRRGGER